uniref:Uncharacterized protein n=1 Tax=Parascaris equorum TaxID=6256 RepID=A0A914R396_PAREQ
MCRRGTRTSGCIQRDRKWRTYWCTLSPGAIYLWPLHKATTASNRKLITLDHGSTILMGSFDEERFTWQLTCAKSKFIFGDFDELRRTHWIHGENQWAICFYPSKCAHFTIQHKKHFNSVNKLLMKEDYFTKWVTSIVHNFT